MRTWCIVIVRRTRSLRSITLEFGETAKLFLTNQHRATSLPILSRSSDFYPTRLSVPSPSLHPQNKQPVTTVSLRILGHPQGDRTVVSSLASRPQWAGNFWEGGLFPSWRGPSKLSPCRGNNLKAEKPFAGSERKQHGLEKQYWGLVYTGKVPRDETTQRVVYFGL